MACWSNLPTLAWLEISLYYWSFYWSLYVNSPPTASFSGSEKGDFGQQSCSLLLVIAHVSAVAIHFQHIRHILIFIIVVLRMSITRSKCYHTLTQRSPLPLLYKLPQVCNMTPSYLEYSPISAVIGNHPCPLHMDQHGGSEAGGVCQRTTLKGENGNLN